LVGPLVYLSLVGAIVVSFTSSLLEATYLSVSPVSLNMAAEAGDPRARIAFGLTSEKTKLVSSTTFMDSVSSVVLATATGVIFSEAFGTAGWFIGIAVGSLSIMTLLTLLPKAIGIENSVRMAIILAPGAKTALGILSPVTLPLTSLARSLSQRIIGRPAYTEADLVDEFEHLIGMLEREGHIEPDAGKILRATVSSSKRTAASILTPIAQIVSVDSKSTVLDALKVIGKTAHPHLPVYDSDARKYVGAVTYRSLTAAIAKGATSDQASKYMVQPAVVETDEGVATVVDIMQKAHATMAFVRAKGEIVGMVTMTDILEIVMGVKV